jgi:hypothetical protein
VACEWRTFSNDDGGFYSPRLDVAVGPFATGELQLGAEYDGMVTTNREFFLGLFEIFLRNLRERASNAVEPDFREVMHRNWNARCLVAIEIENKVSRKHLMGGAINAAALGRVGVVVAWTLPMLVALLRLRSYLHFLARVGKNTFAPYNLVIVSAQQVAEYCGIDY